MYETREATGNLVFTFASGAEIKCHSQVVLSQSEYFRGLLDFNERAGVAADITRHAVHDYSPDLFQVMIDFLYLGEARVNSDDMTDLLQMCQQFFLVKMKLALEAKFAENLDKSNLVDTFMIAKAFECNYLKQRIAQFSEENGCGKKFTDL